MKDDSQTDGRPAAKPAEDKRQERLKLALRENLKRRKSQAKGKADLIKGGFTPASSAADELDPQGGEESPG